MHYKQLTIEEREKIQELLWKNESIRNIAKYLNRNPSSISREIQRNSSKLRHEYRPRIAQTRADEHKTHRGREERLKNKNIREYVVDKLKNGWSPEQISGRLKLEQSERAISHEAIYQFIYAQIYRDGYGYLKPGKEDLRSFLRQKRKRRKIKGYHKWQRICVKRGPSIDQRPAVVNRRSRIGDWEGDTVESKDHKPGINTLVERKIGLLKITKLNGKTSSATTEAVRKALYKVPQHFKLTLTLDNGAENQGWQEIQETTNIKCYFAHPYHSWERGSNENTNGLIRDYFPKKTDFSIITNEELQKVEDLLNNRPRKRLAYKTPLEMWSVALES